MDSSPTPPDPRPARAPKLSAREQRRVRRNLERRKSSLIWVLLGAGALAFFGFLLATALRPQAGEDVPLLPNTPHIPFPTPPGPYNSNPPTSGLHYAQSAPAGFYDEARAESLGQFPEGYLVHSLEHDYNIFWYNCSALDEAACAALKEQIQAVMSGFDGFKLIAYPWPSQPEPVVLTHWGRILRMQSFDAGAARNFIESNRRRSPEPDAS